MSFDNPSCLSRWHSTYKWLLQDEAFLWCQDNTMLTILRQAFLSCHCSFLLIILHPPFPPPLYFTACVCVSVFVSSLSLCQYLSKLGLRETETRHCPL